MVVFPNAKINLGLNICSKREDGYHEISSVFFPIALFDALEITENKENTINFISEGIEIPTDPKGNLVIQAYNLIKTEYNIPGVDVTLIKRIPIGAGMGGGSADASFMLTGLNTLFGLNISTKKLEEFAKKLGADCPFFIENEAKIVSGIGEIMKPISLDLKGYYLWVVNPEIHISTKEAYAGVQPKHPEKSIEEIIELPIEEWKNLLVNDFEKSIFPNHPKIEILKQQLYDYGAIYASMTGSGSTVFGIFSEEPEQNLNYPNWKIEL
jgi:4-diphosphocytidyl-2-C-methyl-D-erythritol kinase